MATPIQRIAIPTGCSASWLDARRITTDLGGLPKNALYDTAFRGPGIQPNVDQIVAWANEVLVHPKQDGIFHSGRDAIDAAVDSLGRRWVLPANDIPKDVVGRRGMGLLVEPLEVGEEERWVVIVPARIHILHKLPQISDKWGKVDETTGVPTEMKGSDLEEVPETERRSLLRNEGMGVRPLLRYIADFGDWRLVNARTPWDSKAAVAFAFAEPIAEEAMA